MSDTVDVHPQWITAASPHRVAMEIIATTAGTRTTLVQLVTVGAQT